MNIDLKKAQVVYKKTIENAAQYAQVIASKIGCTFCPVDDIKNDSSLLIVIGGDGTLLKCARYASKYDMPVFGFNMGRLGFLSQADLNECDSVLAELNAGEFRIEERMMLSALDGSPALNDIVIKDIDCSTTSDLELFINGKQVCSYLADGLIISTPTGSTAYNLSAGGAVIAPEIECITIVPICAHTLSARPIVVSADDTVEIHSNLTSEFQVIADGKLVYVKKEKVIIKKHEKKAKLLLLNNKEFYDILRCKLHWGVAPGA
ncbi:MAG: NAD(+)/NADH kinase [Candidatus Gastranaerophilales bacterium]|nr:NAD(+)/NADH kinase [Candidatus Gastranaerophilales bacterium]